jgi:hypothetical protein
MDTQSKSKLGHLLIAKSMAEAVLITAVSVGFYFVTTNPYLRGTLDYADNQTVAGWAVDEGQPAARVEVQLYLDGIFVGDQAAGEFRPDLQAAKRAEDDYHGFVFKLPIIPPGDHEARVYATHAGGNGVRRTLQLIGKPLRFRVTGSDKGGAPR